MDSFISTEFIQVRSLTMSYKRAGEGFPIVLVHGWPNSSYLWRHLMPKLAETQRVYAPDLPGFGKSDKPRNAEYRFSYYSEYLEAFCEALELSYIDLVVQDIGGPTGLLWAVRQPKHIRNIIILNAPIYPFSTPFDRLSQTLFTLPFSRDWLMSPAGLKFIWRSFVVNKKVFTKEVLEAYLEPFKNTKNRMFIRDLLLNALKHHHDLEGLAGKLADLNKPTAIIYGRKDPLCAAHMRQLAKDIGHAKVIPFQNCSHLIQEDCPEKLWQEISIFLSKNDSKGDSD